MSSSITQGGNMIKTLYDNLLQKLNISNYTILEIFKTGSQLFRNNPNDLDFVAVLDVFENKYYREPITHENKKYDLIIIDYEEYKKKLTSPMIFTEVYKLYNYLYCDYFKQIIYGGIDFEYNLLDYKNEYLFFLKDLYVNSIGKSINKINFGKVFVHYYILLTIFDKNDISLTEEERQNVVKLYNKDETIIPLINELDSRLCEK